MSDGFFIFFIIITVWISGFTMGGYSYDIRDKAIEHGCAQYNSQTSKFEWIEK